MHAPRDWLRLSAGDVQAETSSVNPSGRCEDSSSYSSIVRAPVGSAVRDGANGTSCQLLSVLMPVRNQRWALAEMVRRVLAAPVVQPIELIVVDDHSDDGSWEVLRELEAQESRIVAIRHDRPQGLGGALKTAISRMNGDLAILQPVDPSYDPREYPWLLAPLLENEADAVLGTRWDGETRRVTSNTDHVRRRWLTGLCNLICGLNLSESPGCFKAIRTSVLRQIRLSSKTGTVDAELVCRLAQWGARLHQVPASHFGNRERDENAAGWLAALAAVARLAYARWFDTQFTHHSGFYILSAVARAKSYNRWILDQVRKYLGNRLLEAGSGIGNLSSLLLDRDHLVLVDYEPEYVSALRQRFSDRGNVRVDWGDLTQASTYAPWRADRLDTIFCSNVLEHLEPDEDVLQNYWETLEPGGHCIVVVPAERWLYTGMDQELGHFRRYTQDELREKMLKAGFEVVFTRQFSRLGAVSWAISGHVLKRRHLSPRQMIWFDRLLPVARLLEYLLPVPGMSLIMVGRKPQREARRQAA